MRKLLPTLLFSLFSVLLAHAQMREVYNWSYTQNQLTGMSFYQANEGYASFVGSIGFTSDSGRTFTQKYITISNVDFGPYYPSLTFGFYPNGIHAFNKDTLLVYGHYGFMPSILYSTNQGNSYKLIFFSIYNSNDPGFGILNMKFPGNGNIGFATDKDRILKSTDRGKTWAPVYSIANAGFRQIEFPVNGNEGYIAGEKNLFKTSNGGSSWQNSYGPPNYSNDSYTGLSFINNNKGWAIIYPNIYYTSNGGLSWIQKNDNIRYPVYSATFTNDSTGYYGGREFDTYKTTDSGRIWERLPRDNNHSYLGYYADKLFFLNSNQFWAGGGVYPHIELTTNAGGTTIPKAIFSIDTAQLTPTNTIKLTNYGKQGPAYTYKWLRNNVLISATYNLSYTTPRTSIDTIKLIVTKGMYTDTATQIVDTRLPIYIAPCRANFSFAVDTASVKFTSTYNDVTWKHYWYFGDGTVDSSSANPVHTYTSLPTSYPLWYTVKHLVKSTLSACSDSVANTVTITRLQRCLVPDFTFRADNFFTNQIYLKGLLAIYTESNLTFRGTWNYGDGTTSAISPASSIPFNTSHRYDSAKTYQLCLSLTNDATGCTTTICKPVSINITTNCDATFKVLNSTDSAAAAYNYVDTGINLRGKPLAINSGKRHSWTVDNSQTFNTGNKNALNTSLKTAVNISHMSTYGYECRYYDLKAVQLDALAKVIKHDVFDSATNCTDSKQTMVQVPRSLTSPRIETYINPELPQRVIFSVYNGNSAQICNFEANGQFNCCYPTWQYTRQYTTTKDDPVSFMPMYNGSTCVGKDVYYKTIHVDFESCAIISPHIKTTTSSSNPLAITFYDTAVTYGGSLYPMPLIANSEEGVWYFGDGDSTRTFGLTIASAITHTYAAPGNYLVTRKQKSADNCFKKRFAWITVGNVAAPTCTLVPQFYASADPVQPGTIKFINYTTPDTSTVFYKWYFGNGDSSTLKKPVYTYHATGTYTVKLQATMNGCTKYYDSTINVVYLPCSNPTDFRDTTIYLLCGTETVNLNSIYNIGSLPAQWNTSNTQYAGIGSYSVIVRGGTPCRDTAFVTVKQDVARWTGSVSSNWNNAANWSTGKVPTTYTHVIIANTTNSCNLDSDVAVASLQVRPGAVFHVSNNHTITIIANCNPLPN